MKPIVFCAAIIAFAIPLLATTGRADTWRGTAPFCAGQCAANEDQIGVSDSGDGGYCVTGHKVLCRNASTMCQAKETKASCYGVVMVCENGYHESLNQNWHGCNSYACGACFGISIDSTHPQSTGGGVHPDICKPGFVWREAVKGDHACVTPATRTQTAQDDAAAPSRRAGGGASGPDTCKQGFVWREAVANDHVCVVPAVRAAAVEDNRLARGRVATQAVPVVLDRCKQGFVWREAIKGDHICVVPANREQAAADNARAAERRSPTGGASGPDTCKQGFVWREVVPSDHACVTLQVRNVVAQDTAAAGQRLAR